FARGLSELSAYLGATEFEKLRLVSNVSASEAKSEVGSPRQTNRYVTGVLHEGSPDSAVAAFQGDVAFRITVRSKITGLPPGPPSDVDIDLAGMGGAPRTLSNVVNHINAALEAAGVQTRVGREKLPS